MNKARIRPLSVLLGVLALAALPALGEPSQDPAPDLACPPCDDHNPCTVDSCDPSTGTCRYEAVSCDDGNPCTADSCHIFALTSPCSKVGCCNNPVNSGACDDGNSCTSADHCASGACIGSTLPEGTSCDDRNPCTELDACDAAGSCVGQALLPGTPCEDGTPCTTGDTCQLDGTGSIACVGTPLDCSDGDPCTQDLCDPTGTCVHPPVDCDDGNDCTTDSLVCAGGLICQHTPRTGSCQDVDPCTPADSCSDGVCVGGGSCDDQIDCTRDFCVYPEGCFHAPDNSLCVNSNPCIFSTCNPLLGGCTRQILYGHGCGPDSCHPGICTLEGSCFVWPKCDDGNACTQDACNQGACSATPLTGNPCSTGDVCTVGQTCLAGVCSGGTVDPSRGLPSVSIDQLTPNLLKPSHKLVQVTATVTAKTQCGAPLQAILVSITSNQPDDAPGGGDGHTTGDIQGADYGTPDYTFFLRGEYDKKLGPRFYTITYSVTANGSTSTASTMIYVGVHGGGGHTATIPGKQKPLPK